MRRNVLFGVGAVALVALAASSLARAGDIHFLIEAHVQCVARMRAKLQ